MLPLSACNCEDETSADPWEFEEPWPMEMGQVAPDMALEPDLAEPPPAEIPPDIPWEKEVVAEVPRSQALNDRTSLGVADDGTVWLGFHPCEDDDCFESWLATASQNGDEPWRIERIAPQRGTFGLDVYENEPWVAYLDETNNQFRVGRRDQQGRGPRAWTLMPMPVDFSGRFDGLDITHDDERIYVTFASDSANAPVDLFVKDMTRPGSSWIELAKLDVRDASAALERGLTTDGRGNLYLVHRDGQTGPYGVARFRLRDNIWDRQSYFPDPDIIVSSSVARANGDFCMSSTVTGRSGFFADGFLEMTCGRMNDLRRGLWQFEDETVSSYSSLIEGRDGSLIIAYNAGGNTELRVARRYPDGTWDRRTVFDGSSYGVSTAIDKDNKLLISYYTCQRSRCTLEILRQPY